jgi:hypothetical protein
MGEVDLELGSQRMGHGIYYWTDSSQGCFGGNLSGMGIWLGSEPKRHLGESL